jgi:hypothetical protein
MKRRAGCGLAEEPRDEAPDEGADDAEHARHDEAQVSGPRDEQLGDRTHDDADDEHPDEVQHVCLHGVECGGERGIRTLEGLLTLTPLAGLGKNPTPSTAFFKRRIL